MKRKKKKRPARIHIIIAFISLCIIAAGLFYFLVKPSLRTSKPVFEEDYASSNKFRKIRWKVDHLIYDSLYDEGVKEEDISFTNVIHRHKNDLDWDFTELTVRLDSPDSISRLINSILKKISNLQPDVALKTRKISSTEFVLNIKIFNFLSHRLILRHEAKKKAEIGKLPRVAFIIDDIGYDESLAASFMKLDIPVCLSVLPNAPYSKEIAAKTVKNGRELLLHLPMEPKGYPEINPGKGALMIDMDRPTIQKIVRNDIMKFPGLKGVNHHMGSLFSENYIKMKYVLDEIKKYNLYYVDSRTTNRTVAYKVAKALGVPAAEKSVFIDNDLSEKALKYQMGRLLGIARYKGSAIGIGHPHPETLHILEEYTGQLKKSYVVVPVSELVH